jgi:hypothetical protein
MGKNLTFRLEHFGMFVLCKSTRLHPSTMKVNGVRVWSLFLPFLAWHILSGSERQERFNSCVSAA